jgi:hypothetical protein
LLSKLFCINSESKLVLKRRDNALKTVITVKQTEAAFFNGSGFCYFLDADLMRRDETAKSFFPTVAATTGESSSSPSQAKIAFLV